jgi:hypothetical protein
MRHLLATATQRLDFSMLDDFLHSSSTSHHQIIERDGVVVNTLASRPRGPEFNA